MNSAKPKASTRASAPATESAGLSESEFLRRQADEAKQALTHTLSGIGRNVGQGVDPREWTRAHPLGALGSAALAGFLSIRIIMRRANRPRKPQPETSDNSNGEAQPISSASPSAAPPNPPRSSGIGSLLAAEAIRLLRPIVIEMIHSKVRSSDAPHNGHTDGRTDAPPAPSTDVTPPSGP